MGGTVSDVGLYCSKCGLQASSSAWPGSLIDIQNPRPHPRLPGSESAFEQDAEVIFTYTEVQEALGVDYFSLEFCLSFPQGGAFLVLSG